MLASVKRKRLISDHVRYIQQEKTEGLERLLAEKKLSPLTDVERASITNVAAKAKAVKFKGALYVAAMIALPVGLILGFIALF